MLNLNLFSNLQKIKKTIKKYFIFKKLTFHFCVYITEHCNLNCQMCNTFAPIAEEAFYNPDDYKVDCQNLSKLFKKKTHKIIIMGGEPLLHPQIISFLILTRQNFPYKKTQIELLTNGILLSKMPNDFWDSCKKYNITLALTKYPINVDYTSIEKKASSYGINIKYHKGFAQEIERKSYKYKLDETGQQDMNNAYECVSGSVSVLKYGKLYKCPICASINNFNKYFNKNLKRVDSDFINISKNHSCNDIFMFLYKPSPFCKHCVITKNTENKVIDWAISKKDIKEWT